MHPFLFGIGVFQEGEEPVDLAKIFLLCLFDRSVCQVIAQHILGVDTVDGFLTLVVVPLIWPLRP